MPAGEEIEAQGLLPGKQALRGHAQSTSSAPPNSGHAFGTNIAMQARA